MFLILFKIIGIIFCKYGSYYHGSPDEFRELVNSSFMFRYQYLANIGLELTLYTLYLGVFHQVITRFFKKECKCIKKSYEHILSVLLPIEIAITVVFWTLFLYDPKIIRTPVIYEKYGLDLFQNSCVHLLPAILLINEALFCELQRNNLHILFYIFVSPIYYLFLKKVVEHYKTWPYPFLDEATESKRIMIFIAITILIIFIYELNIIIFKKIKKSNKN